MSCALALYILEALYVAQRFSGFLFFFHGCFVRYARYTCSSALRHYLRWTGEGLVSRRGLKPCCYLLPRWESKNICLQAELAKLADVTSTRCDKCLLFSGVVVSGVSHIYHISGSLL